MYYEKMGGDTKTSSSIAYYKALRNGKAKVHLAQQ